MFSCLAVQQPDPNQPKAQGAQMVAMQGEQLGVVTNWPPSLEAALQRWGTISPKAPCLTTMDTNGKPLYTLTYGVFRSLLVSYLKYVVLLRLNKGQCENYSCLVTGGREHESEVCSGGLVHDGHEVTLLKYDCHSDCFYSYFIFSSIFVLRFSFSVFDLFVFIHSKPEKT